MDTEQSHRPRFYEQQFLGAADLTAAIEYTRRHDARHALGAHTWGIAMGLQLKERPAPGGTIEVYVQPGYAWDGFGRPILVPEPSRLPAEQFKSLTYDSQRDEPNGRPVDVWIRYAESAVGGPAAGFEVCVTDDQYSRVHEGHRVVVGEHSEGQRQDRITVAGRLIDARDVFRTFDSADPTIPDESVPHQTFPEDYARARWLLPLGFVRWRPDPVATLSGQFKPRSAEDLVASHAARRYIGAVAESVQAADKVIRMRDRTRPYSTVSSEDLVWVEGKLRVEGDVRLFGGRLDFRRPDGKNLDAAGTPAPLTIQRVDWNRAGTDLTDLQVTIGQDDDPAHRLVIGRGSGNGIAEKVILRADGKVGIGTPAPRNPLAIRAAGTSEELISFENPAGVTKWHVNQNLGGDTPGLNFVETNVADGRIFLEVGGNVGIGTTHPVGRLTINGIAQPQQGLVTFFTNDADVAYDGGDDGLFIFKDTGGKTAFIGGTVGFGTTNPLSSVHMARPSHLNVILDRTDVTEHLTLVVGSSGSGLRFSDSNAFFISSQPYGQRNDTTFGTEHLRITAAGNLGLGTPNPGAKLDVRGSVRLGPTGALFAPGCPDDLRLIAGRVSNTGAELFGAGYTATRTAVGRYAIAFTNAFPAPPVVLATVSDPGGRDNTINVVNLAATGFSISIVDASDNADEDDEFSFVAAGPR